MLCIVFVLGNTLYHSALLHVQHNLSSTSSLLTVLALPPPSPVLELQTAAL